MLYNDNLTATFKRLNELLSSQDRSILSGDEQVEKLSYYKELIGKIEACEDGTITAVFIKNHYATVCDMLANYFISYLDFNSRNAYKHLGCLNLFTASFPVPVTFEELDNADPDKLENVVIEIFNSLLIVKMDFTILIQPPSVEEFENSNNYYFTVCFNASFI